MVASVPQATAKRQRQGGQTQRGSDHNLRLGIVHLLECHWILSPELSLNSPSGVHSHLIRIGRMPQLLLTRRRALFWRFNDPPAAEPPCRPVQATCPSRSQKGRGLSGCGVARASSRCPRTLDERRAQNIASTYVRLQALGNG